MPEAINVVLVTSPGCHFCDEALHVIEGLAETYPLRIATIPLLSDQGRSLLVRHRVPFPPILMIDGEFFGYGRISRRRLEEHLGSRAAGERVV
ncbi:MAG TPA: glutaredoxin [Acidimicrobiia bacterium]